MKTPLKFRIDKEVFKFFKEQSLILNVGDTHPYYMFYPFWLKVNSSIDETDLIIQTINTALDNTDPNYHDMIAALREVLNIKLNMVEISETERIEAIISELDDNLYELCHDLVSTPFFMFKKVWQLKANIKQIKSIKSIIKGFI